MYQFPKPWKVEVNPFGESEDGIDDIFIVTRDGTPVCTINKHPVWNHMQKKRLELAERIVRCINEGKL